MSQIVEFLKINVNFSSLTLEDLDHPKLIQIYSVFWDITFVITTIFFFLMLYIIIKKSTKEMGGYKWYLCHQLCWSYIFELFMSCWKPIPLWPFYLGYSGGIFRHNSSGTWFFKIIIFIAIFMGFSIGISIVHRYVQAAPFSQFYQIYSNIYYRTVAYLIVIALLLSGFYYLLTFMPTIQSLQTSLESQNSIMKIFFAREPSLFGFDPKSDNNITVIIMFSFIIFLILILFLIACLYLNFLRILKRNKTFMSARTFKLQQILFKALYVQVCLIIFILIMPITVSLILAMFGIRWVSTFSLFTFSLLSIHALTDIFTMIYFIHPYQNFINELIKLLLQKLGIHVRAADVGPTTISATIAII